MADEKKYHPYTTLDVNPMECIVCGSEVKLLYTENERPPYHQLSSSMWDDGIVAEISGGYGSKYDTEVFFIAICDKT